ncbi:PHP domain-containing protein [Hydrogenovibrio marinus]|uniref:PHP domain-containing protein n=1 Tax=Hydrogenovibrio marinus TaxID=28885 RepID=UPI0004A6B1AE|nr:PHP domain-containing protein [Hydrogenovibrio marinus]BBN59641.1 phosphoesterase [Hydrogenovibrio marinus]
MSDFKADFHCHTHISDGSLSPEALISLAKERRVTHLSITDHDTTLGYELAKPFADEQGITLISGTEISCQWQGHTIHVVGLDVDVINSDLQNGLKMNRVKRWLRAFEMDTKAQKRFPSLLTDILPKLESGMIGRNHFAHALIERGIVNDQPKAFDRYLKKGRPLYAPVDWPDITEVVEWILSAGGIAVIAHPHIYKMGANKLNKMIETFRDAGGQAIEVVNQPRVCSDQMGMADRAKRFGLYASLGSDFHRPEQSWRGLGWLSPMPNGVDPVWNHFKSPV